MCVCFIHMIYLNFPGTVRGDIILLIGQMRNLDTNSLSNLPNVL